MMKNLNKNVRKGLHMNNSVLILGESGTGKSSSLRTLNPEETFIINVINKPLPFRGSKFKYKRFSSETNEGNYYASDSPVIIRKLIQYVNDNMPHIKNVVLDDFGYTISNTFMRRATQKGYEKFSEIGADTFFILDILTDLRDDLFAFVMMHTDIDINGKYKPRTIGKMIDQYICIEGKFTVCLHALVNDGQYQFLTNNDGQHMAKSPLGMFEQLFIDNDLQYVINNINNYNNDDGAIE